jgi:hypothetical protein
LINKFYFRIAAKSVRASQKIVSLSENFANFSQKDYTNIPAGYPARW